MKEDEILKAIRDRKQAYWSAKGVRLGKPEALTYICAYCAHQGGTLKKDGDFMICDDAVKCRDRKVALPTAKLELLAKLRLENDRE